MEATIAILVDMSNDAEIEILTAAFTGELAAWQKKELAVGVNAQEIQQLAAGERVTGSWVAFTTVDVVDYTNDPNATPMVRLNQPPESPSLVSGRAKFTRLDLAKLRRQQTEYKERYVDLLKLGINLDQTIRWAQRKPGMDSIEQITEVVHHNRRLFGTAEACDALTFRYKDHTVIITNSGVEDVLIEVGKNLDHVGYTDHPNGLTMILKQPNAKTAIATIESLIKLAPG